eukprot:c11189_g1_i1.p1 GENE.c11189_g1_i1~~c11189_g1_i1.p1  ORF type:complete len:875 (-),score=189.61 c11189_g1_i1:168-2792(-)
MERTASNAAGDCHPIKEHDLPAPAISALPSKKPPPTQSSKQPTAYKSLRKHIEHTAKRVREGKFGKFQARIRQHPIYGWLIILVTIVAVFISDFDLAVLPKHADDVVDGILLACFCVFVVDIAFSIVFEPGYWHSVLLPLDVVATVSMMNVMPSSMAIGRVARLIRVVRILRVARFAMASTNIALQKAQEARSAAKRSSLIRRWSQASPEPGQQQNSKSDEPLPGTAAALAARSQPPAISRKTSFLGAKKFKTDSLSPMVQTKKKKSVRIGGGSFSNKRNSLGDGEPSFLSVDSSSSFRSQRPKLRPSMSRTGLRTISRMGQAAANHSSHKDAASVISATLMKRTTEKMILLILAVVLGIHLIEFPSHDDTIQGCVDEFAEAFDMFNRSGCFDLHSPSALSDGVAYSNLCEITPCCVDWKNAVSECTSVVSHNLDHATLTSLTVRSTVFLHHTLNIRSTEIAAAHSHIGNSPSFIEFNAQTFGRTKAAFSLGESIFILVVVLLFPYLFSRDVLQLVITPLEVIFDRIQSIAVNPFRKFGAEPQRKKTKISFEIDMIRESLHRVTKLLQISLGQAGADIVSQNLRSGTFSVLQAGSRIDAVFAFCDIHDFEDCCEVLQEECVVFVNTIAQLIAKEVSRGFGAVNKNAGENFLMAWKWVTESNLHSSLAMNSSVFESAEASLRASLSVLNQIASHEIIQGYAQRQDIRDRLGHDYHVAVGFGLHAGWAIEGAVGSEQKIDATYLSSTVNITARLDTAARQYKVSLLMSHWFHMFLSNERKQRCRKIDKVAMKGSVEAITLITYEEEEVLGVEKASRGNEYYDLYVQGKWLECLRLMLEFLELWPGDGPCENVMAFMSDSGFEAPKDWCGFRKLQAK